MRDDLFKSHNDIANFRFDESVVKVFDDMVKRSVPGYGSMIQMVGLVARMYGKDNTNYYDLGSSTGAITLAISLNNNHKNICNIDELHNYQIISVPDNSNFS